MGTSTDAILLYGISIEEDGFERYDEDNRAAPKKGPAWLAYSGKAEDGVSVEQHQSGDYPRYFVAIEGTPVKAWRGHPQDVTEKALGRNAEWDAKLRAFVAKYKLPTDSEPGWFLMSNWC